MNILILHPSYPGQFVYLCDFLAKNPENKVVFLTKNVNQIAEMIQSINQTSMMLQAKRSFAKAIRLAVPLGRRISGRDLD